VDPAASFHGTHVAGIAPANAGTCSPGGSDHPPTCGLSGVAPRAYLGNYRVFTVPTPVGMVADTPEIVDAFEFAVRDGMDVINFSGGGPATEPANDALIDVVRNVVAATRTTRGGSAVDRRLCGQADDPNTDASSPLAPDTLRGDMALVTRGHCTFASKAARAASAGAVGIVVVDNRTGEADPIGLR